MLRGDGEGEGERSDYMYHHFLLFPQSFFFFFQKTVFSGPLYKTGKRLGYRNRIYGISLSGSREYREKKSCHSRDITQVYFRNSNILRSKSQNELNEYICGTQDTSYFRVNRNYGRKL